MSKSYFILELDTTGPIIEIYAPSYATPYDNVEVFIESSEQLMEYQDIYLVDGAGTKHKLTFQHQGNRMYGLVSFQYMKVGIATLYARLKDEVGNDSNTATGSIHVMHGEKITIDIKEQDRDTVCSSTIRDISVSTQDRDIIEENTVRYIDASEKIRGIEVMDIDSE